jgi:hypothetical protein
LDTIATGVVDLIHTDHETTRKILATLGVDDVYLNLFDSVAQANDSASAFLEKAVGEEKYNEIEDYLGQFMSPERVSKLLYDLYIAVTAPEK